MLKGIVILAAQQKQALADLKANHSELRTELKLLLSAN